MTTPPASGAPQVSRTLPRQIEREVTPSQPNPCAARPDTPPERPVHRWKAAVMVAAEDAWPSLGRPRSSSVVASSE
jgi:hypothetical protein